MTDEGSDRPSRSPRDLYLDGLVTGAVLFWLLSMLYDLLKREQPEIFGTVLFGLVLLSLFIGALYRALRLQGRK